MFVIRLYRIQDLVHSSAQDQFAGGKHKAFDLFPFQFWWQGQCVGVGHDIQQYGTGLIDCGLESGLHLIGVMNRNAFESHGLCDQGKVGIDHICFVVG